VSTRPLPAQFIGGHSAASVEFKTLPYGAGPPAAKPGCRGRPTRLQRRAHAGLPAGIDIDRGVPSSVYSFAAVNVTYSRIPRSIHRRDWRRLDNILIVLIGIEDAFKLMSAPYKMSVVAPITSFNSSTVSNGAFLQVYGGFQHAILNSAPPA